MNFYLTNGTCTYAFNYRGEYSEKESILKTIDQLRKLRLNLNTKDTEGSTLLHYACMTLDYDVIKSLLNRGAELTITDAHGRLPIDIIQDITLHPEFLEHDTYLKMQLNLLLQCLKR